jgi:PIN domain
MEVFRRKGYPFPLTLGMMRCFPERSTISLWRRRQQHLHQRPNFGGPPDKLLDLARAGEIHPYISREIIEEVSRVLPEKFGWEEDAVKVAVERVGDFTEIVRPSEHLAVVEQDPADNRILGCAATADQTTS